MKTRKLRKFLMLLASALLLVSVTVGATVAYLTDTAEVTNTFSVGDVEITMTEAKVNEYGVAVEGAARVTENEYKLIPGHNYLKDPTVYVDADSEDGLLFVEITNGIAAIEKDDENTIDTIAEQMEANGWVNLSGNIYYYNGIVKANDAKIVFGSFTVDGEVDVASYTNAKIAIKAYIVQADGFTTTAEDGTVTGNYQLAWEEAFGA